jgi:hypothetical protein
MNRTKKRKKKKNGSISLCIFFYLRFVLHFLLLPLFLLFRDNADNETKSTTRKNINKRLENCKRSKEKERGIIKLENIARGKSKVKEATKADCVESDLN